MVTKVRVIKVCRRMTYIGSHPQNIASKTMKQVNRSSILYQTSEYKANSEIVNIYIYNSVNRTKVATNCLLQCMLLTQMLHASRLQPDKC